MENMDLLPRITCLLKRNVDKQCIRATQANIAYNPHISKGLSIFRNNRCSWSAVRLCSTWVSRGPDQQVSLETRDGMIKWEVLMGQTWK